MVSTVPLRSAGIAVGPMCRSFDDHSILGVRFGSFGPKSHDSLGDYKRLLRVPILINPVILTVYRSAIVITGRDHFVDPADTNAFRIVSEVAQPGASWARCLGRASRRQARVSRNPGCRGTTQRGPDRHRQVRPHRPGARPPRQQRPSRFEERALSCLRDHLTRRTDSPPEPAHAQIGRLADDPLLDRQHPNSHPQVKTAARLNP